MSGETQRVCTCTITNIVCSQIFPANRYRYIDAASFIFANMTMYTADGELIVAMERFADILKSVTCGENMELAFDDKDSFEYAIRAWKWVNEDETHSFIMVANHPACGPQHERQPYYVYDVDYDEANYIAYLNADQRPWKEVAHTFALDYGSAMLQQNTPRDSLAPRWGPDAGFDKAISLDLSHDMSTNLFTLAPSDGVEVSLDCAGCGISGALKISGHIEVDVTSLKKFEITAQPEDFAASLGLEFVAKVTTKYAYEYEKELFEIPLAGFDIPHVASLGAILTGTVGVSISNVTGEATVSYGVSAHLSNDAIAELDLNNMDDMVTFSGWTPYFEQEPFSIEAKLYTDLNAYFQTSVGLEASIFGMRLRHLVFTILDRC